MEDLAMRRMVLWRTAALVIGMLFIFGCSRDNVNEPVAQQSAASPRALQKSADKSDPAVLALLVQANQQLAAQGLRVAVESAEFFTVGKGRPGARIHQQPFRWVPNDARRNADGENITYMVDVTHGATASGLSSAQTEAAIDRALSTWGADAALKKVTIVKCPYAGIDPSIVDALFGFGGFGTTFQADIINAGWYPRGFFEALGGPGAEPGFSA
jgi:hypothetical protein